MQAKLANPGARSAFKRVMTHGGKGNRLMRRILFVLGLLALALVPLAASAKVTKTDRQNARAECKALKRAAGSRNFAALMRTSRARAYGRCVARKSREEAQERADARKNAAKECKAEQSDPDFAASHDGKTFAQFYGTNANGSNAYGKCVSQKARENKQQADEQDQERINAARACRAEQRDSDFASSHGGKSFREFYGTNRNGRNAFGKCVSKKAQSQNDEQQQSS